MAQTRVSPKLDEVYQRYREAPSQELLSQLAERAQGLIYYFARFYGGQSEPSEDMIQCGYEGLLHAVKRFDPERGATFTTFAGHQILGRIRHHLREEAAFYRPATIKGLHSQVDAVITEILQQKGEVPSVSELAERLNVKEEGIIEVLRSGVVPLDELDLSRVRSRSLETFRLPVEDRLLLEQAIETLTDLQRRAIYLFFYYDLTQTQVGREIGVSQRQVSRLIKRGIKALAAFID